MVQRGGGTPLPQNRARNILYVVVVIIIMAHMHLGNYVPPLEEGHPPLEEGYDNSVHGLILIISFLLHPPVEEGHDNSMYGLIFSNALGKLN